MISSFHRVVISLLFIFCVLIAFVWVNRHGIPPKEKKSITVETVVTPNQGISKDKNIWPNVQTSFNKELETPTISHTSFVHPQSTVIGNVEIGENVMIAPFASVRGDEGQPIHIGNQTNIQDGVVIHALETEENGKTIKKNLVDVNGHSYAVFIGDNVSLAHQALIHGPAYIGSDVFVGMQALVFKAKIGSHVVIEPAAKVIGVSIPDGRYVPAGMVITNQKDADHLPLVSPTYDFATINEEVLHVNVQLAEGYQKALKAER